MPAWIILNKCKLFQELFAKLYSEENVDTSNSHADILISSLEPVPSSSPTSIVPSLSSMSKTSIQSKNTLMVSQARGDPSTFNFNTDLLNVVYGRTFVGNGEIFY
jgi:hypothetical protein